MLDGGGGDNWSYKTCKNSVKLSSLTNHNRLFLQAGGPSCHPTNSVRPLKENWWNIRHSIWSLLWLSFFNCSGRIPITLLKTVNIVAAIVTVMLPNWKSASLCDVNFCSICARTGISYMHNCTCDNISYEFEVSVSLCSRLKGSITTSIKLL